MTIRQPRLLTRDGEERCRLSPVRLSLEMTLAPLSTAEMTLTPDAPDVAVRDLIELYDESGSVGVFRVAEIVEQPGLSRIVRMEHALATLSDGVVPVTALTGSVREALNALLAHQPDPCWVAGDIAIPEDTLILFTCGCQNLLSALMQLAALLPDTLYFACDFATRPWTLHLRELSDEDACEGRLTRNLTSLHITTDATDLCTRVYPFGAGQGPERISLTPLTGQAYLDSPAQAVWGCIARTFTAGNIFDAPTLQAVAEKYLQRHSVPAASITAQAADLHALTGEAADSFRLGRLCRLCLPESGVTLHERVVALHKPDVIGSPGLVTLTLSNRRPDAADEIATLLREVTSSRILGGRVSDVVTHNRASGAADSPIVHYFRVEDWAAVLACRIAFDADDGVRIVRIKVDNTEVPGTLWQTGVFDALPYLRRDALGVIAAGRHALSLYPDSGAMNSTISLKVIEKI